jgi:DNA excision repair protein ERCC-1
MLVCWSNEEVAKYLETYKIYENKPPDVLMDEGPLTSDVGSCIIDSLSCIGKVNKSDGSSLLSVYGTLDSIIGANVEELVLVPGLGQSKARALYQAFHQPFKHT